MKNATTNLNMQQQNQKTQQNQKRIDECEHATA